jgi:hypothetical protein
MVSKIWLRRNISVDEKSRVPLGMEVSEPCGKTISPKKYEKKGGLAQKEAPSPRGGQGVKRGQDS